MRTIHAFMATVVLVVCLVPKALSLSAEPADDSVEKALQWLASQQNDDGSWGFDCPKGPLDGDSSGRGTLEQARNGATGLALLTFMGQGHTHTKGSYKQTVKRGLEYLILNMKVTRERGSLEDADGQFYSHVWATQALCLAYASSRDKDLEKPAQLGLNHIFFKQDPKSGGWRHKRSSPCNLALFGWTLLALNTGHIQAHHAAHHVARLSRLAPQ